ncbi:MAG: phosphoribosylformimino-5-aminoimidazole carboxamide ribotide isomerase [Ruminococcus sp.]|jgi:phosphoribosylformimino-5-aminoimidazole carboxamide ribotide isomerase|nr:phosphoribosylformimino-5-aminoimidazole carboxamide ribotide isomerase [Ruminococcus sp.]
MAKGLFRPCIDIHGGVVKQIVGGELTDSSAVENFVSEKNAAYYAGLYKKHNLPGGHIIILNKRGTPEYDAGVKAAKEALAVFPGGMSIGGGIDVSNALEFPEASADIVTSYIFNGGKISLEKLEKISTLVTPERLILDLSVREIGDEYRITTERWRRISNISINSDNIAGLIPYCKEFLIHAVDKEGKKHGIDKNLANLLYQFMCKWNFPVTYAGGIRCLNDAEYLSNAGLDFTVGSALDIFGGKLKFEELAEKYS